jgi:glycosyltransferase involved in cell wall biosynthesis
MHQILKAMPLIMREYPNARLRVAGVDFVNKPRWRLGGYGNLIRHLIAELGLQNNVEFLGMLPEDAMANQFRRAHVFVCPSSIENSPNSIGEAQLIGVPCVASNVGGMTDMVDHERTGLLYRYEEHEMLAASVCHLFADYDLAKTISANSRAIARIRHDAIANADELYAIYKEVSQ